MVRTQMKRIPDPCGLAPQVNQVGWLPRMMSLVTGEFGIAAD